jgi:exodeoxyribonuclease VII small subunit
MAKKNTGYKQAISELEKILKELENNDVDVDDLTEKVKRAAELIGICKEKLFHADAEIEKILQNLDS